MGLLDGFFDVESESEAASVSGAEVSDAELATLIGSFLSEPGDAADDASVPGLSEPSPHLLPAMVALRDAVRQRGLVKEGEFANDAQLRELATTLLRDGVQFDSVGAVRDWLRLHEHAATGFGQPRTIAGLLAYRKAMSDGQR